MRLAAILVLVCACSRPSPPPAPAPPAPAARAPDDAPLPAPEEVPEFLRERVGAPVAEAVAPAPEAVPPEPTLAELLRHVHEGDGEESFAYVTPTTPGPRASGLEPEVAAQPEEPAPEEAAPPPAAADACAELRARIEQRRDFVERAAAERNRYAYLESDADASALRLLESLRRCEAHPGDPDCQAQPLERDVGELAAAPGTVERDPGDLVAEDGGAEVVHDPGMLALQRELAACERRGVAQPLLTR